MYTHKENNKNHKNDKENHSSNNQNDFPRRQLWRWICWKKKKLLRYNSYQSGLRLQRSVIVPRHEQVVSRERWPQFSYSNHVITILCRNHRWIYFAIYNFFPVFLSSHPFMVFLIYFGFSSDPTNAIKCKYWRCPCFNDSVWAKVLKRIIK